MVEKMKIKKFLFQKNYLKIINEKENFLSNIITLNIEWKISKCFT